MAKGSVRKKGKKWYYRFYIEDESGRQVQREFAGTESKSETEALLRKAMEDYEEKKFVAKSENATVAMLLDMWVEEELKPSNLSNGTVMAYQGTVNRIKQYPIGSRKLKSVTADHLQAFIDFLSFGGVNPDGTTAKALSKGYLRLFSAVLQGAFRFAVFPKRLITFNPMQYVVWRGKKENYELFSDENGETASTPKAVAGLLALLLGRFAHLLNVAVTGGIGIILRVCTVGDNENLHILIQSACRPEAVALIALDLIEGFTDGNAAPFQLHMNQRQTVDEYRHIIAIIMRSTLRRGNLVLIDDLQVVIVNILLVDELNVLG